MNPSPTNPAAAFYASPAARAIAAAVLYFTIMGLSRPILGRGFTVRRTVAAQ